MAWQLEHLKDLDRVRSQLREDFGLARKRGRVPLAVRAAWWAVLATAAAALGDPAAAVPAAALFEGLVAPRLARRARRSVGTLRPWVPPPSWHPSPEAPARIPGLRS
jgi:hypothetical protein